MPELNNLPSVRGLSSDQLVHDAERLLDQARSECARKNWAAADALAALATAQVLAAQYWAGRRTSYHI